MGHSQNSQDSETVVLQLERLQHVVQVLQIPRQHVNHRTSCLLG